MKLKIYRLLALFLCIFALSSCAQTFSNEEYDNLLNKENYQKFDVIFSYAKVINQTYAVPNYSTDDVEIYATFQTLDELKLFHSLGLDNIKDPSKYPIAFISFKGNSKILYDNKFFDEVKEGDKITIWVNLYKTRDTRYNYLAAVEFNGKTYLTMDEGLAGIKAYLDNHKSPFFDPNK